jgi:hypothetical protein
MVKYGPHTEEIMTDDAKEIMYRIEFETGDVMHTADKDLAVLHQQKGRFVTPPLSEKAAEDNPE